MHNITLAVDAMGGDFAPKAALDGVVRFHKICPDVKIKLFGDLNILRKWSLRYNQALKFCELIHTEHVISDKMKPSSALRVGKETSMGLAIESVKRQQSNAIVSCGNTGALMGMATLILKRFEKIRRPAIASLMPTPVKKVLMLDLGANVEAEGQHLFDFAVMGDAFCRAVLELNAPKIGLLNVGSEDIKGHEDVKEAHKLLSNSVFQNQYKGFIEGNDIFKGLVDIVVTDGFTGNIALKSSEGVAKFIRDSIRDVFKESILSKFCYLVCWHYFNKLKRKLDPRSHNGAVLLGVNGIVVKGHGSSDGVAFCSALKLAAQMAKNDYLNKVKANLSTMSSVSVGSSS
jgi:glycerol-3-phosphate acyltransferase PlsX